MRFVNMGHIIGGFIALEKELTELVADYNLAHVVPLKQEFAFVPVSDDLCAQLFEGKQFLADMNDERFRCLSSKLFQIGRWFSKKTPIAYIETDYYGGTGFQCAVAWKDGEIEFYPTVAGREEGFQMDRKTLKPINDALSKIGVQIYLTEDLDADDMDEFTKDEFDKLGLGNYRDNDDWIKSLTEKKA
jgi:hypothetical protein